MATEPVQEMMATLDQAMVDGKAVGRSFSPRHASLPFARKLGLGPISSRSLTWSNSHTWVCCYHTLPSAQPSHVRTDLARSARSASYRERSGISACSSSRTARHCSSELQQQSNISIHRPQSVRPHCSTIRTDHQAPSHPIPSSASPTARGVGSGWIGCGTGVGAGCPTFCSPLCIVFID
jgi:hypothetical protein